MTIKDKLYLAIKNLFAQKPLFIISFLIMTFLFILATISIELPYNLSSFIDTLVNGDLYGRKLYVYKFDTPYADMLENLAKYNHVSYVYNSDYNAINGDMKINDDIPVTNILIYPTNAEISPLITSGRPLNKKGEIVCPRYLATNNKKTKDDLVDLSEYVGQKVNLSYYQLVWKTISEKDDPEAQGKTFTKDLTLVGVYDTTLSVFSSYECYMLEAELLNMKEESKSIYTEKFLENNGVTENGSSSVVIVDKASNVDKVISELTKDDYLVSKALEFDFTIVNLIKIISYIVFIVILIIIIVTIIIYLKKIISNQKYNISLYKIFGYNNKEIKSIITLETSIITLMSFITSLIVIEVFILIVNNHTSNLLYNLLSVYKLKISLLYEIILVIIIIPLLYLITKKITNKINKINIKELIENDDYL